MKEGRNQGAEDLEQQRKTGSHGGVAQSISWTTSCKQPASRLLTLFQVWVCPMRMRALDEMMDRQKLMRMTERSERMYLQHKRISEKSKLATFSHHLQRGRAPPQLPPPVHRPRRAHLCGLHTHPLNPADNIR